jgi:polygalacturonase
MKNIYTPNDFKQLPSDYEMIQAAVDEAAAYGAAVVIPRYNERTGKPIWELDHSVVLKNGSYVIIDNAHIRLMDGAYCHFFENEAGEANKRWWKREGRNSNIRIEGRGNALLDGGVHNGIFEHLFTIYDENGNFVGRREYMGYKTAFINIGIDFRNAEHISVSGLHFVNQRYWAMCFRFCSSVHISDISFEALANVPNQDGIDIREGCRDFLVENITGKTGDDTIALTNFGLSKLLSGGEEPEMSTDIRDVIIRNVRSHLTDECDIIRILNRGGNKIYNVQISGIIDTTDEYSEGRALAAIRIGDICDYQSRLNLPGEVRNITVRDVVTRARFGCYIANSITDSVFENIMMTSDGGVGMYFNGCVIKNVFIDKLTYNSLAKPSDKLLGYKGIFHKVFIDEINAMHFNNSEAENLFVSGVVSGKEIKYVFGGNSDININAEKIVMLDKNTKLADKANIC